MSKRKIEESELRLQVLDFLDDDNRGNYEGLKAYEMVDDILAFLMEGHKGLVQMTDSELLAQLANAIDRGEGIEDPEIDCEHSKLYRDFEAQIALDALLEDKPVKKKRKKR